MSETGSFGDSVYQSGDAVEDSDNLDPLDDLTGDDADEEMQTGFSPPEREPYNLRHIPTEAEEREGESLEQKLSEEEPEFGEDDIYDGDQEPRTGRLVAPDEGAHADEEKDEIASDVGPAGYASSAEEAAVHVIDDDGDEGDDEGEGEDDEGEGEDG
jgi:hypothetical protein